MTRRTFAWLTAGMLGLVFCGLTTSALAADKNATGTWKWTFNRNGEDVNLSVKLKQEGDKLTGTFVGPDGQETEIKDGTINKDGDVKFKVEREFNGNKFTINYSGKVDGDTIKGKTEVERDGETRTRDWEAKRASS
jgi:hypothetical protein